MLVLSTLRTKGSLGLAESQGRGQDRHRAGEETRRQRPHGNPSRGHRSPMTRPASVPSPSDRVNKESPLPWLTAGRVHRGTGLGIASIRGLALEKAVAVEEKP